MEKLLNMWSYVILSLLLSGVCNDKISTIMCSCYYFYKTISWLVTRKQRSWYLYNMLDDSDTAGIGCGTGTDTRELVQP